MLITRFAKTSILCNIFLLIITSFTSIPGGSVSASLHVVKNGVESSLQGIGFSSTEPQIKLNRKGMIFVKKYIRNSGENLASVKKRSTVPFSIIDSVFNRYGLPVELKYLAVIESELKPSALSQVGARGPWQLMPGTARILGLKITSHYDERTNYYKSTRAAARYLKDLYAQFNDWLLVLAAYNGGPKPVNTAIHKSGSRNFWVLQKYLPAESREHVKKFIATHYFFEGRGSETTLTKAEYEKYEQTVSRFLASHPDDGTGQVNHLETASNSTARNRMNISAHTNRKLTLETDLARAENNLQKNKNTYIGVETPEQKFRRVMKESEESLIKSRKVI